MIITQDEIVFIETYGRLMDPKIDPVHYKHFKDGYPLCWSQDQDGPFQGSYEDHEVTCKECLAYTLE